MTCFNAGTSFRTVATFSYCSASDTKMANEAITASDDLRKRCDEVIERLLQGRAAVKTHEAVAYSLLARHYKRVAAHLANISTAVLGRIEELDFGP